MRLKQVDIRLHWDRIKDSITKTLPVGERAEEIYYACRAKKAFLFLVDEGFLILEEFPEEPLEKIMRIWLAYGEGVNLIEKYKTDVDELAKSIGATRIRFRTQRRGFERALPEGWSMNYVEYEKRVI